MEIQNEKAFTLIEVLASIVILIIILVSVMKLFPLMGMMNKQNIDKTEAINLAKVELLAWQSKDLRDFFVHPSKDKIPSFDRFEANYFVFYEEKDNYNLEVWLKKGSDLKSKPIKANMMVIKILNENNAVISETYGYYFYEEG